MDTGYYKMYIQELNNKTAIYGGLLQRAVMDITLRSRALKESRT
jgi:hypothetical protein